MLDALEDQLGRLVEQGSAVNVATTTLLPSGALANVLVRPSGNGTFQITDGGIGRDDLFGVGVSKITGGDRRRGNAIAERLGLIFEDDSFSVRNVAAGQLTAAIVFVADAAREWASTAAQNAARRTELALANTVEQRILQHAPNARISRGAELTGGSSKRHRIDLVWEIDTDRKVIFELVMPNTNSLSSAHLKLFDLKEAHPEWPREAVIESQEGWSGPDLTLLAGVATHVRPIDRQWQDLSRLVH
jgi:hypothetical protein